MNIVLKWVVLQGVLSLGILMLALVPATASAHEVGFDGAMAATLHFAPDDEPISGQSTSISFVELKNQGVSFAPESCNCQLEISKAGQNISTVNLTPSDKSLTANYKFPGKGAYELALIGEAHTTGAFAPFRIRYTETIERAAVAPASSRESLYLLGGLAGVFVIAAVAIVIFLGNSPRGDKVQG